MRDLDGYLVGNLMPSAARESYFTMRALNTELASVRDACRLNPSTAKFRYLFWRELVNGAFQVPPKKPHPHPLAEHLITAVAAHRHTKRWVTRLIDARESDATAEAGPATVSDLEAYGEATASSLFYLALEAVGVRDTAADHAASHMGKAAGIVLALRGLPSHSARGQRYLPLDLLDKNSVTQAELFSAFAPVNGVRAPLPPAVRGAVYDLACVAHAHLSHCEDIVPTMPPPANAALLQTVLTRRYLSQLETVEFDPSHPSLHSNSYLPNYFALLKHTITGTCM